MKYLWIVLFFGLVFPASVFGGEHEDRQAKNLIEAGQHSFEALQYDEAAALFKKAYSIRPSYRILYNVGQCYAAANRHGAALEMFEKFLADGGDDIGEDRENETLKEIHRLREITGFVEIETADGATIYVDGIARGIYPTSQRFAVSAMVVHTIKVMHDNHSTMSKKVKVHGGNVLQISLQPAISPSEQGTAADEMGSESPAQTTNLEEKQPAQELKETQAIAPRNTSPNKKDTSVDTEKGMSASLNKPPIAGWIATGSGLAVLLTGTIVRGVAMKKEQDLEDNCNTDTLLCDSAQEGTLKSRDRLRDASTALWITGAVLAAGGAAILLFSSLRRERTGSPVSIHVSPSGVALTGRF